jgi:hypothetical protein
MSYVPGGRPDLRVSDADRDAVIAELAGHLQEGRLDSEEFGQRLEAAASARTRGDLDTLLADLPRPAPSPQDTAPARRTRYPVTAPVVVAVLVLALLAASYLGGAWTGWHGQWHWGTSWWVFVIPLVLLRRLMGGPRRGPRR